MSDRGQGLSMSFGQAPRPAPALAATANSDPSQPMVLLLQVLVSQGGFAAWVPLAVSTDPGELEKCLGRWMAANHANYGGQFRTSPLPFLLPPGIKL